MKPSKRLSITSNSNLKNNYELLDSAVYWLCVAASAVQYAGGAGRASVQPAVLALHRSHNLLTASVMDSIEEVKYCF